MMTQNSKGQILQDVMIKFQSWNLGWESTRMCRMIIFELQPGRLRNDIQVFAQCYFGNPKFARLYNFT